MNQVQINVSIAEVKPLRHSPAGVSILDLVLEHQSSVIEAEVPRQLEFYFDARAMGKTADQLAEYPLGAELEITGFLTTTRKNSTHLVLHINKAVLLPATH